MVLLGFVFLIFGGIYFMFWASYKIMSWIPMLLVLSGLAMTLEFILAHWIMVLVAYTIIAVLAYIGSGPKSEE